jgi:isoleucyl-tRNA synthetase
MTLYTALETLTRLAAPFVPFVTEQVYQNIVRSVNADAPESVHLCEYPVADTSLINKEIEKEMALAAKVVELGRAARNASSMKNRQPLSEIYVVADYELTDEYKNIVLNELNIRSYKAVKDASALMDFSFKPQLRTCGRKFGKLLNAAKDVIAALPGKETMKALEEGPVTITVEGENFEMTKDDFIVETVQPEGLSTQEDGGITASINTVLTEDLIIDGFVREMISKIQTQRKEAGLEVVDRIILTYEGNEKLASIIAQKKDFIASEVLATDIVEGKDGFTKEWDVNGEKITFGVKKA